MGVSLVNAFEIASFLAMAYTFGLILTFTFTLNS